MAADTTCRTPAPQCLACRGQICGVAQSSGPVSLLGVAPPACHGLRGLLALISLPVCLCLSGRSLQLHIRWAVGDSFLGSTSDREVKRPHLVRPDLRVTAEVAMQTWGSLPRREKSSAQPGCEESSCWPGPVWPPGWWLCPQDVPVTLYSDADEWEMWKCRSDPVLHIDLRRWADLMLVSPLDANTLGKVASGICDNLLTCVIRAWDRSKPLLFCPAMNTAMWEHPITEQQVGQLKAFGYVEIPCVAKKLVCGDQGLGAMAEVGTIVDKVKEVLSQHGAFQQN
ncbi:phosphopantothenoylcysteine decarboxylase isoform X2 [Phocoena sinus]|nr:phosphopantothenoylcysteine decarboxylase isoform X2 [Phocoena sinus]